MTEEELRIAKFAGEYDKLCSEHRMMVSWRVDNQTIVDRVVANEDETGRDRLEKQVREFHGQWQIEP